MSVVDPLVAACDVLVLRALELVGKRIARETRDRHARLRESGRPFHEAHLLWQADETTIDKGLASAWDSCDVILIEHGCCGATPSQVTQILDRYVRDLLLTGTGHAVEELRYRLGAYLGVPV